MFLRWEKKLMDISYFVMFIKYLEYMLYIIFIRLCIVDMKLFFL